MGPLLCPIAHPARTQLTLGSWAGQRHTQATLPIHRNSSRSCAAGSSHLLGQGGLLAGVLSTHTKFWASEGRAPVGVTFGMWAQLNSSCLTPHSLIVPALTGCLAFSTRYTHLLCQRWYQRARRQALVPLLTALLEGLKASATFPPSAALNK